MRRVGIVTCVELPEPDPDQELLLDALRQLGLVAELIAWDDARADPTAFDLCVLRSCWNYHEQPAAFLAWVAHADAVTTLINPASVIRWNSHKSYLRELADLHVPIIPTAWFEQGDDADLAATMNAHAWQDVVIKPAISAGSCRTERFRRDDVERGQAFLASLVCDGDTMVQRYMPSVESPGERALVWIAGQVTHAVIKSPRFADGIEQVSAAVAATAAEQRFAEHVLAAMADDLLYARIDLVEEDDGALLLSELELIEPSLFFLQCPAALERFADALAKLVTTRV